MGTEPFLNAPELARRWKISIRTLERYRSEGKGPRFFKIGGRVRYQIVDVIAYEESMLLEWIK